MPQIRTVYKCEDCPLKCQLSIVREAALIEDGKGVGSKEHFVCQLDGDCEHEFTFAKYAPLNP